MPIISFLKKLLMNLPCILSKVDFSGMIPINITTYVPKINIADDFQKMLCHRNLLIGPQTVYFEWALKIASFGYKQTHIAKSLFIETFIGKRTIFL